MYKNVCRKIGSGENFLVNTALVISSINFVFYRKENLEQLGQMVTLWVSLILTSPAGTKLWRFWDWSAVKGQKKGAKGQSWAKRILHFLIHWMPILWVFMLLWPFPSPHPTLVNVVGGRNDPLGLQHFFWGGEGGVVITSALHVNSLVLKLDMVMSMLHHV